MTTAYYLLKACLDPIVFLLFLTVIGFLVSLRMRGRQLERAIWVTLFFTLYFISISPVSNFMSYLLEKNYLSLNSDEIGYSDIVVILGGGVTGNKYVKATMPSFQTSSRILHALQVFKKTKAKYLVCAGKGTGKVSEAEVMCNIAEKLGIPTNKMKIDKKSRNTWEHAQELDKMFHEKDIKIALITSAYHMKRSEREFKKYFSNIAPLPSDFLYSSSSLSLFTFLPMTSNLYRLSIVMREFVGITWYRIKKLKYENSLP